MVFFKSPQAIRGRPQDNAKESHAQSVIDELKKQAAEEVAKELAAEKAAQATPVQPAEKVLQPVASSSSKAWKLELRWAYADLALNGFYDVLLEHELLLEHKAGVGVNPEFTGKFS